MILSKKLYNPRHERPKSTDRFTSLEEYEVIAEKQIKYFCKRYYPHLTKSFLENEERISDVMYENMVADWEWDPSRGMTLATYRNSRAFWVIKGLAEKMGKKKKIVFYHQSDFENRFKNTELHGTSGGGFDETIYNQRTYENKLDPRLIFHQKDLLESLFVVLPERERYIMNYYYISSMTLEEIGQKLEPKMTRQRVHQIIADTKKKLEQVGLAG